MAIEEIKEELIEQGKDPSDFNITITENGYSVTPRWFYETKQIAQKEDIPIKEDIDIVAELTSIVAMDKDELAEMLVYALMKIDELEVKING